MNLWKSGIYALAIVTTVATSWAAEITIVKAQYGAGDKWNDVTTKVKDLVAAGKPVIPVNNGLFGDAAPKMAKMLKVTLTYNGKTLNMQGAERSNLDLSETKVAAFAAAPAPVAAKPEPQVDYKGIEIISAEYSGKDKTIDVTAKVKAMVAAGKKIMATNANFTDPSRGFAKKLTVKFKFNGKEQEKSAGENKQLVLP